MIRARLVMAAYPCNACQIANDLNVETLKKVSAMRDDFQFEIILVGHPRELAGVEGLEVEKLPAVLINGEQISAGSVLAPRQVMKILEDFETDGSFAKEVPGAP